MVAHGTEGISFRGGSGRLESPGPSHVQHPTAAFWFGWGLKLTT